MKPDQAGICSRLTRLLAFCLLTVLIVLPAQGAVVVLKDIDRHPQDINKQLEIWRDTSAKKTFNDVLNREISQKFIPIPSKDLRASYSHDVIWLRVTLKNPQKHELQRYLEVSTPRLEDIRLYQQDTSGEWQVSQAGSRIPVRQRLIESRYSIFPLGFSSSEDKLVYIRIQSRNSIMLNIRLWEANAFNAYTSQVDVANSMQFGALALFVLYALILFFGTRDTVYLYFGVVVASCIANDISLMQYGYTYLWPNSFEWNVRSPGITGTPLLIASALLVMKLLQLRESMPKVAVGLTVMIWCITFNAFAMYWLDYTFWVILQQLLGGALLISLAIITFYTVFKGLRDSLLVLTSFIVVWSIGLVRLAQIAGLLGHDFAIDYSQNWGMILSGALVVGLLNGKLKKYEQERIRLEKAVVEEKVRADYAAQQELANRTRELQTAKEMAEAESHAKTTFIAQLSHELRTPLHSVLGYSNLILASQPPQELNRRVSAIQQSGQHLLNLINRLLDFARIEAGRIHLEPQPVNLHHFLTSLVDEYRLLASNQGVLLRVNVDTSVYAKVSLDEARLRQILSNLIVNAYQHSYGTMIELAARAEREGDSLKVWLAVQDNGKGINKEDQEKFFQAFVSGTGMSKQTRYNMGLGLSSARDLIRLMGGELGYERSVAAGGQFYFAVTLPWLDNEPVDAVNKAIPLPVYSGESRCILVVNGQPEKCTLLADLLTNMGFHALTATSGEEAKNLLVREPVDLVFTPSELPDMPCCSLMSYGALVGSSAKFVQLSRHLDEPPANCSTAGKFAAVLWEPFEPGQVATILTELWPGSWQARSDDLAEAKLQPPSAIFMERLAMAVNGGMISDIYDWIEEVVIQEPESADFAWAVQAALLSMDLDAIKRIIGYNK